MAKLKEAPPIPPPQPLKFSGTVYSIVAKPWQGFSDYVILELEIKDDVVVKQSEKTGPLCGAEALGWLEIYEERQLEKLRKNYPVKGLRTI
jgi:hypothetical protein